MDKKKQKKEPKCGKKCGCAKCGLSKFYITNEEIVKCIIKSGGSAKRSFYKQSPLDLMF